MHENIFLIKPRRQCIHSLTILIMVRDFALKLFDHTVVSILTYGSEMYGFEDLNIIEKVHKYVLRKLIGARKSTPSYIIYG